MPNMCSRNNMYHISVLGISKGVIGAGLEGFVYNPPPRKDTSSDQNNEAQGWEEPKESGVSSAADGG